MANLEVKTAMSLGSAQASGMGLGQSSANALGIKNLMSQDDDGGGMIKTLMQSGSKNRLKGSAFKKDLMSIGQAAIGGAGSGALISWARTTEGPSSA